MSANSVIFFDLLNIVDATVNELLCVYVFVVPTFSTLDVEPMFVNQIQFGQVFGTF